MFAWGAQGEASIPHCGGAVVAEWSVLRAHVPASEAGLSPAQAQSPAHAEVENSRAGRLHCPTRPQRFQPATITVPLAVSGLAKRTVLPSGETEGDSAADVFTMVRRRLLIV